MCWVRWCATARRSCVMCGCMRRRIDLTHSERSKYCSHQCGVQVARLQLLDALRDTKPGEQARLFASCHTTATPHVEHSDDVVVEVDVPPEVTSVFATPRLLAESADDADRECVAWGLGHLAPCLMVAVCVGVACAYCVGAGKRQCRSWAGPRRSWRCRSLTRRTCQTAPHRIAMPAWRTVTPPWYTLTRVPHRHRLPSTTLRPQRRKPQLSPPVWVVVVVVVVVVMAPVTTQQSRAARQLLMQAPLQRWQPFWRQLSLTSAVAPPLALAPHLVLMLMLMLVLVLVLALMLMLVLMLTLTLTRRRRQWLQRLPPLPRAHHRLRPSDHTNGRALWYRQRRRRLRVAAPALLRPAPGGASRWHAAPPASAVSRPVSWWCMPKSACARYGRHPASVAVVVAVAVWL